jgi:hypothetical protein
MVNGDGAAPPFLCRSGPLVEMGVVANKTIHFVGVKYAVGTALA